MAPTVETVRIQVKGIVPLDETERIHQIDTLNWLASTDDVFRRIAPSTPPKHVVSYFLLCDPTDGSILLVDHRKAGLLLPTGGHVEPGEDPVETVKREAREELGIEAVFASHPPAPSFVTVTETSGLPGLRHTDVSLWFPLVGSRRQSLTPDLGEFVSVRWWTPAETSAADPDIFDPHLGRFLTKLGRTGPSSIVE